MFPKTKVSKILAVIIVTGRSFLHPNFTGEEGHIKGTGGPQSEISGSLKNLKPEKNRPLSKIQSGYSRPSNTQIRGSTIDFKKFAVHWAAMTTPSKQ